VGEGRTGRALGAEEEVKIGHGEMRPGRGSGSLHNIQCKNETDPVFL